MSKTRKVLVIIVSVLIVLTLAFIWCNSMISKANSSSESDSVYRGFFKAFFDIIFGEGVITHSIFRKMAHLTEFAVLGAEINCLYLLINKLSLKKVTEILFFGLAVGFIDEIIQLLSDRGSSVKDVIIDFSGYLISTVVIFGIFYLVKHIKKRGKSNNSEK